MKFLSEPGRTTIRSSGSFDSSLETKSAYVPPDFSLDTNYRSNLVPPHSQYCYFSDPVSGLTAFIDIYKFAVEVIDNLRLKSLGIALPNKNFKGLFLHLKPQYADQSSPMFVVLVHHKSGTTLKDQSIRNNEADTIKRIIDSLYALAPCYRSTNICVIQSDTNISSHIPDNPKDTRDSYLLNPRNYTLNRDGLTNLSLRLKPRNYQLSQIATASRISIKQYANDMASNQNGTKRNTKEPSAKGMTFVMSKDDKSGSTLTEVLNRILHPYQVPRQFGVNQKDSDHHFVRPVVANGTTFVTQPLINVFGKMGFRKESDFYKVIPLTELDKIEIRLMKEQMTRDHLYNIMDELKKKNIVHETLTLEALKEGATNFEEYSQFILLHEWAITQDLPTLTRIITQFSELPSFKACNELYKPEKQVFTCSHNGVEACLSLILNKNYRITIDKTEGQYPEPERVESITVKQLQGALVYAVKNHDPHGRIIYGEIKDFNLTLEDNGELSEENELALRDKIFTLVNAQYPVAANQRQTMTKGSQIDNNMSCHLGWQIKAGFPENIPNWNPGAKQNKTTIALVENYGADIIVRTKDSSKKHLNRKKPSQRENAIQRDEEQYVQSWQSQMDETCKDLNKAKQAFELKWESSTYKLSYFLNQKNKSEYQKFYLDYLLNHHLEHAAREGLEAKILLDIATEMSDLPVQCEEIIKIYLNQSGYIDSIIDYIGIEIKKTPLALVISREPADKEAASIERKSYSPKSI